MDNEKQNEFEGKADCSTQYEIRRCTRNDSKEQVISRLKRSAAPVAFLVVCLVIAYIMK